MTLQLFIRTGAGRIGLLRRCLSCLARHVPPGLPLSVTLVSDSEARDKVVSEAHLFTSCFPLRVLAAQAIPQSALPEGISYALEDALMVREGSLQALTEADGPAHVEALEVPAHLLAWVDGHGYNICPQLYDACERFPWLGPPPLVSLTHGPGQVVGPVCLRQSSPALSLLAENCTFEKVWSNG